MLLFAYLPLKRSFLAKADGFARNGVGEFQFGGQIAGPAPDRRQLRGDAGQGLFDFPEALHAAGFPAAQHGRIILFAEMNFRKRVLGKRLIGDHREINPSAIGVDRPADMDILHGRRRFELLLLADAEPHADAAGIQIIEDRPVEIAPDGQGAEPLANLFEFAVEAVGFVEQRGGFVDRVEALLGGTGSGGGDDFVFPGEFFDLGSDFFSGGVFVGQADGVVGTAFADLFDLHDAEFAQFRERLILLFGQRDQRDLLHRYDHILQCSRTIDITNESARRRAPDICNWSTHRPPSGRGHEVYPC